MRRPRVILAVRYVNHYREPFYGGLREELDKRGVDFEVVHGSPSPADQSKKDDIVLPWTKKKENRVFSVGDRELIYQPVLRLTGDYDMVIVEQASRLLINYLLVARRATGKGPLVTMLGHGANVWSNPSKLGEGLKKFFTSRLDWFFAYTDGTRDRLIESGFDPERITVFENTLDLSGLRGHLDSISTEEVAAFRKKHGAESKPLVLILGSIYGDKRVDLIVPTTQGLSRAGVAHQVVIVGDGPGRPGLEAEASGVQTISFSEPLFDRDKALALKAADVLFIPGTSGLILLDGFAAGLPIVTARNPHHPPEIDYLNDANSIMLPEPSASGYVDTLSELLQDNDRRRTLGEAAFASGSRLTIENLVNRFSQGVLDALEHDPR